jgi:hypothetical protein
MMNKRFQLLTMLALPWISMAQAPVSEQPYFQQEVDHRIEVRLDDVRHELHGTITTTYTNHSPNDLGELYIHLWPNAYKDGTTALAQQQFREGNLFMFWAMQRELGGIDSLDFRVNGEPVEWSLDAEHVDIARIALPQPLAPGGQLTYSTPFRVQLPSGKISRLGHIGESYQLTQWYPKPAVYDLDGWHPMPYLNQGEFYSEYGSFDVSITLPANYVVGSTGDLDPAEADNARELAFLDSLALATARRVDGSAFDADRFDTEEAMEFPASDPRTKTLRYRQSNVHDFAWFADKRWWVLKGEVALPNTGRKVTSWAMFTPASADLWRRSLEYIEDATYYYSKWNGEYPYNHVTAVDGTISAGGGMEYPNVTVIGNSGSALGLETVIVHEVGHNWFYGILGSNERTNAWMDEGINSFNETRYFVEKYGDKLGLAGFEDRATPLMERFDLVGKSYKSRDVFTYFLSARMAIDQPMQCHSNDFTSTNYGTVVYKKTAAAFDYLRNSLGTERFDRGMQAYFDAWKFKHPAPGDLRAALEASTGEDLGWFFDGLVPTTEQTDYAICSARPAGETTEVTVKNHGGLTGPWSLHGQTAEGPWEPIDWFAGEAPGNRVTVEVPHYDAYRIDHEGVMLDINPHNNTLRTHGVFKRVEPLDMGLLTRLDDGTKTQLGWLPATGWNKQDGFMMGAALHNTVLPLRDFEWMAMPLYAFGSKQVNGMARLSLKRNAWRFEGTGRSFSDAFISDYFDVRYGRHELKAIRSFNHNPADPNRARLELSAIDMRSLGGYGADVIDPGFAPVTSEYRQALRLVYTLERSNVRTQQSLRLRGTWAGRAYDEYNQYLFASYATPGLFPQHSDKGSVWEATWEGQREINRNGAKWSWRCYAAASHGDHNVYNLQTMGINGQNDLLRDHLVFSRSNDSFAGRVVAQEQGGLALLGGTEFSNHPVRSLVTVKVARSLFAGISAYGGGVFSSGQEGAVAGLEWAARICKIQVPMVTFIPAGNAWYTLANTGAPAVTMVLNLERLSPYQALRGGKFMP